MSDTKFNHRFNFQFLTSPCLISDSICSTCYIFELSTSSPRPHWAQNVRHMFLGRSKSKRGTTPKYFGEYKPK